MKRFFFFFSLVSLTLSLWFPSQSRADARLFPMLTYQVAVSSITEYLVSVTTSTVNGATQVDSPQLAGRVTIEIQNIDTAANLWCTVSSTAPNTNNGRKVAPGSSWIVSIKDAFTPMGSIVSTAIKFWCLSDGTASSKAWITQMF
jgi:hypothetical protein